ncbi:MAG: Arm DNA-binding domain-containing protein, partial [Deltaproteobacteria bacterium]|nr:Arm DNA-binding domain-containing protein [Deltaproteobacteria bacterium]
MYIAPSGLRSWRVNYKFQGTQSTMTFGTYPLVSLKQARDQLVDAKRLLSSGINPSTHKKILKNADKAEAENSFETVAREWFERKKVGKKES